jgi:ADP-ribose pyrophosphatase YjhB (NUDIX family)
MGVKFYKLRAIVLLYIIRFLTRVLFLEAPPTIFSVTGLIERGDTLLFLNLSYSKGLGLPGGVVKGGETLEEALRREVFEETGLSVRHSEYLASFASLYHGFPTMASVFLAETLGDMKSSEEGELVWMKPEDALGKLFYKDGDRTIRKFLEVRGRRKQS